MSASIYEHNPRQTPQNSSGERPLAQSLFSGEARLRELEHLAENARKVRDQAAAELTRGSGATHHVARERIAVAERMLRKTQAEIAELRLQLAHPVTGTGTPQTGITAQDFELAVLLGHNKGRFNQVGGEHVPLELQQDTASFRRASANPTLESRSDRGRSGRGHKLNWLMSALIVLGVGLGGFGAYAMLHENGMSGATQAVREGTTQLIIRLRALLPTSDAGGHTTIKATYSKAHRHANRQPI